MAQFSKDHQPTGKAAQKAALPDDFRITGAIRVAGSPTPLTKGFETQYAETKPSVADVERLVEAGVLGVMDRDGNIVAFEVEAAEDEDDSAEKTLEEGTIAELVELAKTEGHDLGTATKKADIIAAIVAGRQAQAENGE